MSLLINPNKYVGGNLLTISLQQGPLFTSVDQSETCN